MAVSGESAKESAKVEAETGFGTGLRGKLKKRQDLAPAPEANGAPPPPEADEQEPAPDPAAAPPEPVSVAPETLLRFRELVAANGIDPKTIVRELKAVGGDLRALRLVLTGRERGPELWAVIAALPPEETLRRIDAAL